MLASSNNITKEQGQQQNTSSNERREALPPVSDIMDTRLPYNIEYIVCNLLRMMVSKGILSVDDARRIMASGESYLH
jgi:hypothetical protein